MTLYRTVVYTLECDECGEISDEYQYGQPESEEFGGRGTLYARRSASRDGWTTFSDRDLCPEHSGKTNR